MARLFDEQTPSGLEYRAAYKNENRKKQPKDAEK